MYPLNDKRNIDFLKKRTETPKIVASGNEERIIFSGERSDSLILEKQKAARENLRAFVLNNLGNDRHLLELVDEIVANGGEALRALFNDDTAFLKKHRQMTDHLEIVIQTDGSRPSFVISEGAIDLRSSPVTDWGELLTARRSMLEEAIKSVGRIETYGAGIATGFLVAPNLVMTNRHVLEAIGTINNDDWILPTGSSIDFGVEFRGLRSWNKSELLRVVFAGPDPINKKLDHAKLDIALIEIKPANGIMQPLSVDLLEDWPQDDMPIFTIGYPTTFDGYNYSLLDLLFRNQFGFKRFSPGRIQMEQTSGLPGWTLCHDATTLGGNSGSVILNLNQENVSAGIHYGGTTTPLANWGHILGAAMPVQYKGKTLKQVLDGYGVQYFK